MGLFGGKKNWLDKEKDRKAKIAEKERRQKSKEAEEFVKKAGRANTDGGEYLMIKYIDEALKIKPDHILAWIIKGNVLNRLDKYEEAINCFDKAISIDPNDARTWFNKALTHDNLRQYEEAINCFDKVISINPNDLNGRNAYSLRCKLLEKFSKLQNKKNIVRKGWSESEKEQVRIDQDGKCALCHKPPPRWEYDHIDGNRSNDSVSNCQGLCPNCHSIKTHEEVN